MSAGDRGRLHLERSKETTMAREIFVNLPVRDLKRSMEFFSRLGFEFNPRFTDDKAACMVLSDKGYVMLLSEPFFRTFTKRQVCDTSTHTEGLFALSCASRDEVNELVRKAIAAGGTHAMDPQDHGFMYGWSFYDLDGHHWEVLWMDPKFASGEAGA
jgi:predicted lactoylglutathione lyase